MSDLKMCRRVMSDGTTVQTCLMGGIGRLGTGTSVVWWGMQLVARAAFVYTTDVKQLLECIHAPQTQQLPCSPQFCRDTLTGTSSIPSSRLLLVHLSGQAASMSFGGLTVALTLPHFVDAPSCTQARLNRRWRDGSSTRTSTGEPPLSRVCRSPALSSSRHTRLIANSNAQTASLSCFLAADAAVNRSARFVNTPAILYLPFNSSSCSDLSP